MVNLSERQWEFAALIHEGLTNKEIAARLDLSPGTVKLYLARDIYTKLPPGGGSRRTRVALMFERGEFALKPKKPGRVKGDTNAKRAELVHRLMQDDPETSPELPVLASRPQAPERTRLDDPKPAKVRAKDASDERWNRIFDEKFADPGYYGGLKLRHSSPLTSV
jgi:hypothetical protein